MITVYVPGIVYRDFKTKVLRVGEIKIDYESPVEVLIKAKKNVKLSKDAKIRADIVNKGEESVNGTLWVWVEKGNISMEFSRDMFIEPESSKKEYFSFKPNETGKYKVTAVFDSESLVGPRYQYFEVWKHWKHKHCKHWCWFVEFLQKHKRCLELFD